MTFPCPSCNIVFTRARNRDRHFKNIHSRIEAIHDCTLCKEVFETRHALIEHRSIHKPSTGFKLIRSAHKRKCSIYRKSYSTKQRNFTEAAFQDRAGLKKVLQYHVAIQSQIKASVIVAAEFIKTDSNGGVTDTYEIYLRAPTKSLVNNRDISIFISQSNQYIDERINNFISEGSNWRLEEILYTDLELAGCEPLNGGCGQLSITYFSKIKKIRKPPKVDEENCFFECVAYHFKKSTNKSVLRRFMKRKMVCKIPVPVDIKDIAKFEKQNQHLKLKINVLYTEGKRIAPLYVSHEVGKKIVINLLLYKSMKKGKVTPHYIHIDNVEKLLQKSYGGNGKYRTYAKGARCVNCLTKFSSSKILSEHEKDCYKNKPQKIKIPDKGDVIQFEHHQNKFDVQFFGFYDFEAALCKPQNPCKKCGQQPGCHHKTTVENIQSPVMYVLIIIDKAGEVVHTNTYSGEDCVVHFFDTILNLEKKLLEKMEQIIPLTMCEADIVNFNVSKTCHICEKPLHGDKVRDHCHITGEFKGAAHNLCNLQRTEKKKIPLFAHGASGYDSHFLIKEMVNDPRIKNIKALPYNTEKFRTLSFNSYVFLDSAAFLGAKLEDLASDLNTIKAHPYKIMDQVGLYNEHEPEKKNLLLRKGVFPYEFVTSFSKLKETKSMPSKAEFFSKLYNANISDEDYDHAKKVFSTFGCKDLMSYAQLYCKTDCVLLAECVQRFRLQIKESFGLEMGYVYTRIALNLQLYLFKVSS